MKKIIAIAILSLILASCSNIVFLNEEGFRLFAYPQFITKENACVQSLDGFVVDGKIYTEFVGDRPLAVENVLDHDIRAKITDIDGSRWILIPAGSNYLIE